MMQPYPAHSASAPFTESLQAFLAASYDAQGQDAPILRKCITHFKDRFREMVRAIRDNDGGTPGKTETLAEVGAQGRRITLTVRLKGALYPSAAGLRASDAKRFLTPTMKEAGFELLTAFPEIESALGAESWGTVLAGRPGGAVAAMSWNEPDSDEVILQAALLWHHPADDISQKAAEEGAAGMLPASSGVLTFADGELRWAPPLSFRLVRTDRYGLDGASLLYGQESAAMTLRDPYDPAGVALIEAASNAKASYEDLARLGSRLMKSEAGVQELPWRELHEAFAVWVQDPEVLTWFELRGMDLARAIHDDAEGPLIPTSIVTTPDPSGPTRLSCCVHVRPDTVKVRMGWYRDSFGSELRLSVNLEVHSNRGGAYVPRFRSTTVPAGSWTGILNLYKPEGRRALLDAMLPGLQAGIQDLAAEWKQAR
jgi:hypothetical protein